jgi:hypothetical protein
MSSAELARFVWRLASSRDSMEDLPERYGARCGAERGGGCQLRGRLRFEDLPTRDELIVAVPGRWQELYRGDDFFVVDP